MALGWLPKERAEQLAVVVTKALEFSDAGAEIDFVCLNAVVHSLATRHLYHWPEMTAREGVKLAFQMAEAWHETGVGYNWETRKWS